MKKDEYLAKRKQAAWMIEEFNKAACIHFAEVLRDQDGADRICDELGIPREALIPKAHFEAAYRLLSFGKLSDRVTLMLGEVKDIKRLLDRTVDREGFYDDNEVWVELP